MDKGANMEAKDKEGIRKEGVNNVGACMIKVQLDIGIRSDVLWSGSDSF